MAYEDITSEVLLEEMLAEVREDVDKREGSVTYDMLAPVSVELEMIYSELDAVLLNGFAPTSEGNYIDLRASEMGVYRKAATKSTGQVTFYGTNGTRVPLGTRLLSDTDPVVFFVTTEDGLISEGSVTLNVEAELAGADGNVSVGRIVGTVTPINGLESVANLSDTIGGVDTETDRDLIDRYLDKVRKPATSGNVFHYEQWAEEVAGISSAKVFPVWSGNGTVKVVLMGDDRRAPSSEKIDEVLAYIEARRPVGAEVTVIGATEVPINIAATVKKDLSTDTGEMVEDFTEKLLDYFGELAFVEDTVRYTKVSALLLDSLGVIDFSNLRVNGTSENIILGAESIPVIGSVTLDVSV